MRFRLIAHLVFTGVVFTQPTFGQCPAGPGDGEGDFFPIHEDGVWTFDQFISGSSHSEYQSESGTLTLEFLAVNCENGTRIAEVKQHRIGIGFANVYGEIYEWEYDEETTLHVTETAEGIYLPTISSHFTGLIPRYSPSQTDNVVYNPEVTSDCIAPLAEVELVRNQGLNEFAYSCSGHTGSESTHRLTRTETVNNEQGPASQLLGSLSVYPNPARSTLSVVVGAELSSKANITMYDMLGRAVKEFSTRANGQVIQLDIGDLPGGAYTIYVEAEDFKSEQQLVTVVR